MTLLDQNRVKAARLESGTGRMYFEMLPKEEAPASAASASPTPPTAAASTSATAKPSKNTPATASRSTIRSSPPQAATESTEATPAAAAAASTSGCSSVASRFKKQVGLVCAKWGDVMWSVCVYGFMCVYVYVCVHCSTLQNFLASVCVCVLALFLSVLPFDFAGSHTAMKCENLLARLHS